MACTPQQEKRPQGEVHALDLEISPHLLQLVEKPMQE